MTGKYDMQIFEITTCISQNLGGTFAFTVSRKEDTVLPLIDTTDNGKFLAPLWLNPVSTE